MIKFFNSAIDLSFNMGKHELKSVQKIYIHINTRIYILYKLL